MNSERIGEMLMAPLSNMMNTHARSELGPFSNQEIWTSILSDVLLCGGVVIPATSFLCNPAIIPWLNSQNHRELIEWLWSSGRLRVLFYDDNRNFESLSDVLIRSKSRALQLLKKKEVNVGELAKRLDRIFSHQNGKLFADAKEANNLKTHISSSLINEMSALPELQLFQELIKSEAKITLIEGRVLDGTWWTRLPDTQTQLAGLKNQFYAVGVAVFDFASSWVLDRLLSGHTYAKRISSFQQMASPLVRKSSVTIKPKILDEAVNYVDPAIFVKDIVKELTLRDIEAISENNEIQTAYNYLTRSFSDFYRNLNEDSLLDVKEKFDKYINSLGTFIRTQPMVAYIDALKDLKRCKSKLELNKFGQSVLTSLHIDKIPGGGIFINVLRWKELELEKHRKERNRYLDTHRPLPFKTLTKIGMHAEE